MELFNNIFGTEETNSGKFDYKEYYETDRHGIIPSYPVLVLDNLESLDFVFYMHVGLFYYEWLQDIPEEDEVVIDVLGRIFKFKYHEEGKFRYPYFTNEEIGFTAIYNIVRRCRPGKYDDYSGQKSIPELYEELQLKKE